MTCCLLPPTLKQGHRDPFWTHFLVNGIFLPPNTPMYSIKRNFNTHLGHYGEMASWQMRSVNFPMPNKTIA